MSETNMKNNIKKIYLDYNSTTPADRRVVESMMPVFADQFGNPSSENHDTGRTARDLVENARSQVADIINMKPADVIFTSGATEANNLAIHGLAITADRPLVALVGMTDHKSVLEPYRFLNGRGGTVKHIPVTSDGALDLAAIDEALSHGHVDVISVMAANSETGVINPIREVARRARAHETLVHCDATQAIGKIPFDAGDLDVDMVTFSSHKIYGPKGCGALVATRQARRQIQGMMHGGGQEKNMRSGTLNVPGIVGFGRACEIAAGEGLQDSARQERLRDDFEVKMIRSIPDIMINGKNSPRLPNTSNIRIAGALADAVIVHAPGAEISTGSACTSAAMEPSHVLTAMGLTTDEANESIRISIGRDTTQQDIDAAVSEIAKSAQFVRDKEAGVKA